MSAYDPRPPLSDDPSLRAIMNDAISDAMRDASREWRGDIDEAVRTLERAVSSLGDDLLELGRQHARDVEALRESIRATDRVLADRTAHLA